VQGALGEDDQTTQSDATHQLQHQHQTHTRIRRHSSSRSTDGLVCVHHTQAYTDIPGAGIPGAQGAAVFTDNGLPAHLENMFEEVRPPLQ
jgi:hypothetical protein